MNKLQPARIIHPKQVFQRELEARGETVDTLEAKTGIDWGIWEQIRTGARIDDTLAHALESWWGTPAQFWLNLWDAYLKRIGDRPMDLACPDCGKRMVAEHDGVRWSWDCGCD